MDWSLFTERYKDIIPHFEGFLEALEKPFPTGLRAQRPLEEWLSRISADSYHKPFSDLNFYEVSGERKFWGGRLEHHHGLYFMQAFSSLLSVLALEVKKGETVLDMCAAPGGKTVHMAQLMENSGLLVACEPDLKRRRILKANLNRMLVANCMVFGCRGQELDFKEGSFDKILLDGPCSSEGTFRDDTVRGSKRRKVNYLTYNKTFRKELYQEQAELLDAALALLKEGGALVYSTCTYDPDENEGAIDRLLKRSSDSNINIKIEDINFTQDIEEKLCPGITSYQKQQYQRELSKTRRVYPHKLNSIGFYIAKIRKLPS